MERWADGASLTTVLVYNIMFGIGSGRFLVKRLSNFYGHVRYEEGTNLMAKTLRD